VLLMESPVSAGKPDPERSSRLSFAEGDEVLLATGSAAQRKPVLTADLVLLLNEELSRSKGCELNPVEAVAAPSEGNWSTSLSTGLRRSE
jgi:hypothetical protein